VAKHRRRLSLESWEKLVTLLIGAVGSIVKLIDAISKLR
jgi:hypothetical protein